MAEAIRNESDNCETMLKRFLTFARPVAFNPEPVDICEVANQVIAKLADSAAQKKVATITDYPDKLPAFVSDRVALDQILTNLIKNAIEAVPDEGQVSLVISSDYDKSLIAIEVSDNGSGIDSESFAKIFSPFFTTKEQGTGLGLSIVKKLVSGLGGNVEIESDRLSGTKFTIILNTEYLENRPVSGKKPAVTA
jgi:signal transduction histidine kinase